MCSGEEFIFRANWQKGGWKNASFITPKKWNSNIFGAIDKTPEGELEEHTSPKDEERL